MASPRTLTFGIEFEFLIAILPLLSRDPLPSPEAQRKTARFPPSSLPDYKKIKKNQSRVPGTDFDTYGLVCEAIANRLRDAGIPAYPWWRAAERTMIGGTNRYAASATDLLGWEIKTDSSLRSPSSDGSASPFWSGEAEMDPYVYLGIEVASPVLTKRFTGSTLLDDLAFEQVAKVAQVLAESFRIMVNGSCGLHVHVGDGTRGFRKLVLQKLMAFLWAFEPGVEKLHPPRRRDPKRARYCVPLRLGAPRELQVAEPEAQIEMIMNAWGYREMCTTLFEDAFEGRDLRCAAYNIKNLDELYDSSKKTIEFRQHRGTLDAAEATRWARFCVAVVDFAHTCGRKEMRRICVAEVCMQREKREFMELSAVCEGIGFWEGRKAWEMVGMGVEDDEDQEEDDGDGDLGIPESPI